MNASNGSEEVTSLFEELVKIYPELHLTEELLPDLVLKPKERASTSSNAASVKQKLKDSFKVLSEKSALKLDIEIFVK